MKPLLLLSALQTFVLLYVCHLLGAQQAASVAQTQNILKTLPQAIAQAQLTAQIEHESRLADLKTQDYLRTMPAPQNEADAKVRAALEATLK